MSTPTTNPKTFSWTDPTTNIDGTPIAANEITSYEIGVRNTDAAGSVAGTYPILLAAPAGSTSALLSSESSPLPPGNYAAAVQAVTANSVSAWSNEATFSIVEIPNAPTGFSVA